MINIAHPPVSSKPPLKRFAAGKNLGKTCNPRPVVAFGTEASRSREKNVSIPSTASEHEDSSVDPTNVAADMTIRDSQKHVDGSKQTTNDRDRSVIEPDSSSFQQLCDTIGDLEENIGINAAMDDENLADALRISPMFDENGEYLFSREYSPQDKPEKDGSTNICISNGSTYEDIMNFLGTLERDTIIPELRVTDDRCQRQIAKNLTRHPESLKEDLSTALLRLEDREATLNMLKEELKAERKIACEKLENQRIESSSKLRAEKSKYRDVVKRHQKFIERLLAEKKDLSEKCNALAVKMKESEAERQREMKAVLDRHAVELQRAKEFCAATEKVRRERWLEGKTSKIKEMTVKGLEPELRNMLDRHQQEIQHIRSTHMKELEDVELRTIRRSNRQLEELRLELTASHDKIVSDEREALRVRFQEKFEEQESLLQAQRRTFIDESERAKKKFAEEEVRRDAERDFALKQSTKQFNERIETLTRQHRIEMRNLEESLQGEREAWIENYRRRQSGKFETAQARIIEECNRERDRQIEIAIATLERETRDANSNMQKNFENKLRCVKDKYEMELRDVNEQLECLKEKFASSRQKLVELEKNEEITEDRLANCMRELNTAKQSIDRLTLERDRAKKIARQEIDSEKRELEDKIASLYRELTQNNANRDSVMAQLYSRIKLIVTQKDLSIKNITREANELRDKCEHLERLLDHQRKEYVLKSL